MIWLLIFCTHVDGGSVCLPPQKMESIEQCRKVGNSLISTANDASGFARVKATCVRVK